MNFGDISIKDIDYLLISNNLSTSLSLYII